MAEVYLGLGSNLGDKQQNILQALELLKQKGLDISKVSSFFVTKPYGVTEQPDFVNAVCAAQTQLPPLELLILLKGIEKKLGRTETSRWGPRLIDLDILLYADLVWQAEKLSLPHPDMLNRLFVLEPLCELAPDKKHPLEQKTFRELWQQLKERENL